MRKLARDIGGPWTGTSQVDPTVALGCPLGTSAALQESSICSTYLVTCVLICTFFAQKSVYFL